MLKTVLIGAGAIARHAYLPSLKDRRVLDLQAVVDADASRTEDLAKEFDLAYAGSHLESALKHADAAIVCVPNHLHYAIARYCLEEGKHVLCEKPICTRSIEGEELLRIAERNSRVFTVAHVRRFYPAVGEIKRIIAEREFGSLLGFDFREGTVFSWPSVTGFALDREKAGGGVLMDIGIHVLDLLFWWLGDTVHSFQYSDDSCGGLEATVDLKITFGNGISGRVKLTRLSVLRNFYTLEFEKATVSWNPFVPKRIYIKQGQKTVSRKLTDENAIRTMLADFSGSVQKRRPPLVTGAAALASLRFVESCYAHRQTIPMSWLRSKVS